MNINTEKHRPANVPYQLHSLFEDVGLGSLTGAEGVITNQVSEQALWGKGLVGQVDEK